MLWLCFLSGEDALDLSELLCHCFAGAEELGDVGPVEKGGQCFCEHVDDHVECWEVDEADLVGLNSLCLK